MVDYTFTDGLYRTYIRTTYTDEWTVDQTINSNVFEFQQGDPEREITLFENGTLNMNFFKTSNFLDCVEDVGQSTSFSRLSQYFLTNKCLVCRQRNGSKYYVSGDYITKDYVRATSGVNHLIPIQRAYRVKQIKMIARMADRAYLGYDEFSVGAAYVDSSNNITASVKWPLTYDKTDWTEVVFDVPSSWPYIDYIFLEGCDASPQIKSIKMVVGS